MPAVLPFIWGHLSRQIYRILLGNTHDIETSFDLMGDEWFGWGRKDDFALGEPAIEVVHYYRGNEGLSEPCGKANQRILEEGLMNYRELVLAFGIIGWIDR